MQTQCKSGCQSSFTFFSYSKDAWQVFASYFFSCLLMNGSMPPCTPMLCPSSASIFCSDLSILICLSMIEGSCQMLMQSIRIQSMRIHPRPAWLPFIGLARAKMDLHGRVKCNKWWFSRSEVKAANVKRFVYNLKGCNSVMHVHTICKSPWRGRRLIKPHPIVDDGKPPHEY